MNTMWGGQFCPQPPFRRLYQSPAESRRSQDWLPHAADMGILARAIFREVALAAALGTTLFTLVLFMYRLGSGKLFEILVAGSASGSTVTYLLSLLLPFALVFALPTGTLVGVLIGLGRMSSRRRNHRDARRRRPQPPRDRARPFLLDARDGRRRYLLALSAALRAS